MNFHYTRPTARIYDFAEAYVREYEHAGRAEREHMDKVRPGGYAAALGVIRAWSKPDDGRQSETPEQRREHIARVRAEYVIPKA